MYSRIYTLTIYQDNEIGFLEGTIPKQQAFVADSSVASLFTLLKFSWTFFSPAEVHTNTLSRH